MLRVKVRPRAAWLAARGDVVVPLLSYHRSVPQPCEDLQFVALFLYSRVGYGVITRYTAMRSLSGRVAGTQPFIQKFFFQLEISL